MLRAALVFIANAFLWLAVVACSSTPAPTPSPTSPPPTAQATIDPSSAAGQLLSGKTLTFKVIPSQSEASYEVREHIFRFPNPQTTIGKTNALEGEFKLSLKNGKPTIEGTNLRVDLRMLKSDQSQRDRYIRENNLESNKYPFAEFVVTGVDEFPRETAEGKDLPFKVTGNMTIHSVTKVLTFDLTANLNGDTLTGTGKTFLLMSDFGFEAPDLGEILKVTDGVTVTVKGTAKFSP